MPYGGWFSIGNPGTLYAFADTSPEGDGLTYDTLIGDPQPDPGCAQVGAVIFRDVCNFNTTFTLSGNYVSAYRDRRDPVKKLSGTDRIDSWLSFDAHLAFQAKDLTRVVLSAINATDEEPPLVYGDLMYDAYSHNGLGRLVKLGVSVAY